jgi:hypothetical protein
MAEYKKLFELMTEELRIRRDLEEIQKNLTYLDKIEQRTTGEELGKSLTNLFDVQSKARNIEHCLEMLEKQIPILFLQQHYESTNAKWNWVDANEFKKTDYLGKSSNKDRLMHTWNNIGTIDIKFNYVVSYVSGNSTMTIENLRNDEFLRFYINLPKYLDDHSCIKMKICDSTVIMTCSIDNYKNAIEKLKQTLSVQRCEIGKVFQNTVTSVIELTGEHQEKKNTFKNQKNDIEANLMEIMNAQNEIKKILQIDDGITSNMLDRMNKTYQSNIKTVSEASYGMLSEI